MVYRLLAVRVLEVDGDPPLNVLLRLVLLRQCELPAVAAVRLAWSSSASEVAGPGGRAGRAVISFSAPSFPCSHLSGPDHEADGATAERAERSTKDLNGPSKVRTGGVATR